MAQDNVFTRITVQKAADLDSGTILSAGQYPKFVVNLSKSIQGVTSEELGEAVTRTEAAANKAATSEKNAKTSETNAKNSQTAAATSQTEAKKSQDAAKVSETNSKNSETAAKNSQTAAASSQAAAKTSETNAKASENAAKASQTAAASSQSAAKTSETNAKNSETAAKNSQTAAANSQTAAKTSETNAKASEVAAKTSETNTVNALSKYIPIGTGGANKAFNYGSGGHGYFTWVEGGTRVAYLGFSNSGETQVKLTNEKRDGDINLLTTGNGKVRANNIPVVIEGKDGFHGGTSSIRHNNEQEFLAAARDQKISSRIFRNDQATLINGMARYSPALLIKAGDTWTNLSIDFNTGRLTTRGGNSSGSVNSPTRSYPFSDEVWTRDEANDRFVGRKINIPDGTDLLNYFRNAKSGFYGAGDRVINGVGTTCDYLWQAHDETVTGAGTPHSWGVLTAKTLSTGKEYTITLKNNEWGDWISSDQTWEPLSANNDKAGWVLFARISGGANDRFNFTINGWAGGFGPESHSRLSEVLVTINNGNNARNISATNFKFGINSGSYGNIRIKQVTGTSAELYIKVAEYSRLTVTCRYHSAGFVSPNVISNTSQILTDAGLPLGGTGDKLTIDAYNRVVYSEATPEMIVRTNTLSPTSYQRVDSQMSVANRFDVLADGKESNSYVTRLYSLSSGRTGIGVRQPNGDWADFDLPKRAKGSVSTLAIEGNIINALNYYAAESLTGLTSANLGQNNITDEFLIIGPARGGNDPTTNLTAMLGDIYGYRGNVTEGVRAIRYSIRYTNGYLSTPYLVVTGDSSVDSQVFLYIVTAMYKGRRVLAIKLASQGGSLNRGCIFSGTMVLQDSDTNWRTIDKGYCLSVVRTSELSNIEKVGDVGSVFDGVLPKKYNTYLPVSFDGPAIRLSPKNEGYTSYLQFDTTEGIRRGYIGYGSSTPQYGKDLTIRNDDRNLTLTLSNILRINSHFESEGYLVSRSTDSRRRIEVRGSVAEGSMGIGFTYDNAATWNTALLPVFPTGVINSNLLVAANASRPKGYKTGGGDRELVNIVRYGYLEGRSDKPENVDVNNGADFPLGVTASITNGTDVGFAVGYAAVINSRGWIDQSGAGAWGQVIIKDGHLMVRSATTNNGKYTVQNRIWGTINTAVDANGFIKKASPIVKLFSERLELNEEAEGVTLNKLGKGHYIIEGVLGFNSDGAWGVNGGVVVPKDENDQPIIWVKTKVLKNGNIEVRTFHRQHKDSPELFQNFRVREVLEGVPIYYEDGEIMDIPDNTWIDLRVEMPEDSIYNIKRKEQEEAMKAQEVRYKRKEALDKLVEEQHYWLHNTTKELVE